MRGEAAAVPHHYDTESGDIKAWATPSAPAARLQRAAHFRLPDRECVRVSVSERMATLVEPVDTSAPFGGVSSTRNTASPTASTHHFDEGKYYLLVVIGELVTDEHLKCAIADIEKGSSADKNNEQMLCSASVLFMP